MNIALSFIVDDKFYRVLAIPQFIEPNICTFYSVKNHSFNEYLCNYGALFFAEYIINLSVREKHKSYSHLLTFCVVVYVVVMPIPSF